MRSDWTIAILLLTTICGCGGDSATPPQAAGAKANAPEQKKAVEAKESVPLEQVPDLALEAARKELPEVTFNQAWKEIEDGEQVFELKGKTKEGKIREVEVSATGKIKKVE